MSETFSNETVKSYIDAIKHQNTESFTDFDSLEKSLNK